MKDNLTEVVFLLDRSGSMGGLEGDTIGGYNSFIEAQKQFDGQVNLTTVLFDDRYELVHDRVDLARVAPLTSKQYYVRGSTALLDAIGKSIDSLGVCLAQTPQDERPSKVVFVITTDGMENASRSYSLAKIKSMIEHQTQKYSWEFLFLGANMDAVGVAGDMGICKDRAVKFKNDSAGIARNYDAVCCAIQTLRASKTLDKDWKSQIEKAENEQ